MRGFHFQNLLQMAIGVLKLKFTPLEYTYLGVIDLNWSSLTWHFSNGLEVNSYNPQSS